MSYLSDLTSSEKALAAKDAARDAAATAAKAPPATVAPQAPSADAAAAYAGPHLVKDAQSGKHVFEDADGGIYLKDSFGTTQKFAPQDAWKQLASNSVWQPAEKADVDTHIAKQKWDDASFAAKSDYAARRILTTVADGVTAPAQLAAFIGSGGNAAIAKDWSGESVVRHLDALLAGDKTAEAESQGARELEPGAPTALNVGTDVAGLTLGSGLASKAAGLAKGALGTAAKAATLEGFGEGAGSIASKLAEKAGLSASNAERLGAYANTVAQGAAIGSSQAAHEAWLKDEKLTAEAEWNSIGMGALLGFGGHAAVDVARALPRAGLSAAEKVFGKPAIEATGELADSISGIKQPPETAGVVSKLLDWTQNKIDELQAEHTGQKLERVKEYNANSAEIEKLAGSRDQIFEQARGDLTSALKELHANGEELSKNVTDVAMKKAHMARLLEDTDHEAILTAGRKKAAELSDGLEQIKANRELLGSPKATKDIRTAYETAITSLENAAAPEDVTSAIDVFKRSTQRAESLASKARSKLAYETDIKAAENRMQLMYDVSENAKSMLEDEGLFGKFGAAQKSVNSRMNQMLESNRYVQRALFEETGEQSRGLGFGRKTYEIAPAKVESYLNGLGTARSETLDRLLRDNISSRDALAEALGDGYSLNPAHVKGAKDAAAKANGVLTGLDKSLRALNLRDELMAGSAARAGQAHDGIATAAMLGHLLAGHTGAVGATLVKAMANVTNPVKFAQKMIMMRASAAKLENLASKSVGRALSAIPEGSGKVAKLVLAKESQEAYQRRFANTATKVAELQNDPQSAVDATAEHIQHVEHSGVQQALAATSMNALGFLASKLPQPLYKDAVGGGKNDFQYVSASNVDQFMRYTAAVNKPAEFFHDLANGVATQEQAETAATLMPEAYAHAQEEAIQKFASGKVTAPYQTRLNVQRMLQIQVQPTATPELQQFLQQQIQQLQSPQPKPQMGNSGSGAPSAAKNTASPLSNLKV